MRDKGHSEMKFRNELLVLPKVEKINDVPLLMDLVSKTAKNCYTNNVLMFKIELSLHKQNVSD